MTGIVEEKTESNDSQPNEKKSKNVHLQNLKKASQMNGEVTGPVENGAVDLPNGDIPNGDHSPDDEKEDSDLQEEEKMESTDSSPEDKAVVDKPEDGSTVATDKDHEVVVIQDTGFNVTIKAPGLESFELQVSSMELVQEIYQVLIDREDTCSRTCFSLQLEGQTMDNFAELKTIEGLQEGSVIKVVEEPYTVREARIHVRHVRDLLKSVDSQDAYNAVDCNSLSFLNVISGETGLEKIVKTQEAVDCTPPDYIVPGSKERPLVPLHPNSKLLKAPQCLKILTYSGWNPPPGNRRMHGDLLYLYVVTLEEKRYHVTASTRGYYVNNCTQDEFNPRPASQKHLSHSLIDLLSQISPAFKRNFQVLLKQRAQKHPFERVATPYQIYSWLAPAVEHSVDFIRAEDAFSSRLGYEEHIPGQTRDWNSELQTTRELPRKALPERLIRERAVFKVHSDFVVAATRGAISVIDGNIMAINPGEDAKMQMFLWNNIFFSLGFDVKDHYKDFGGDAAAYASPGSDLQGVRAYSSVDEEGLYTLGTVVVDYRGYRVTAQSIIPGILEREQEQSVVYGSIDFGKTVVNEEKYNEFLRKTATALKIRPHKVLNDKDEEVELHSSVECKGIVGDDGRHYVLDLLRTFPPDANYLPAEGEELSDEVRAMGYPRKHRHKIVTLRQELIDAFVENRYIAFVKQAAFQFQQLRLKKLQSDQKKQDQEKPEDSGPIEKDKLSKTELIKEEDLEAEEAKKIVNELTTDSSTYEESTKEIVEKACKEVGSLSDTEFDISFNPDVFQPSVTHVNPEGENFKREKNLVKDAAKFLLLHQIPSFIRDCLEHASSPIDGYTLTEALHHNGINMRYLGKVTEMVAKYPQLSYLHSICVAELICRSVKHLFKIYMQGVETMSLSAAVSHFLNCFIGAYPNPHTQVATDELFSQRSKKRNRRKNKAYGSLVMSLSQDNTDWATESPRSLWRKIVDEVREYHQYRLECESSETAVEKYGFQKVSLLRSFCKKCGIQLLLRDYSLDSKSKQTFYEEDIVNIFPSVKHIHPKATDAYHVFTSGQNKIQQGLLRDGYELISEALNLLNNVYGAMHPEIAACARLLARLNYIMGDYSEALLYQQRAVLMSERVLGIDHPNTITEYAHLALYSYANKEIPTALKLMYRTRYLALLCCGENHPEVALFDTNIGVILHAVFEFDLSLRFLHKALELNTKFFGAISLKVAMNYHLVARTYSCKGDFRTALQNEKEAFSIYKQLLGKDHERTKESSECLKHLTQQAVNFQKTMNQLSKGDSVSSIPPIQIQTPSLASVLETLNHINGIVFLHISQDDIDKFREEMVKRQRQTPGEESAEGQNKDTSENSSTDSSPSTASSATSTNSPTTTTSTTSTISATQTVEETSKQASDINANIARDDEASR